jgi:molybdopterin-guanine dinucleotide biosynthesis protein A
MAGQSITRVTSRDITGVILAGGRGSRLGGADKGLVPLRGRPLIEHVISILRPQVGRLVISANRNRETYAAYGVPVIADAIGDYHGPLAGILSALRAADTPFVLCAPCDTPALPSDLAERLIAALAREPAPIAVATCGARMQPVFALVHRTLAQPLQDYLVGGGREAGEWMRRQNAALADFSDVADAFVNINTPQELLAAEGRE